MTNALTWGHIAAARRLIQDARPERLTFVLERWMEVTPDAPGLKDFLSDLKRDGVLIVSPANPDYRGPAPPLGPRRVMPQFILAWWAKVVP